MFFKLRDASPESGKTPVSLLSLGAGVRLALAMVVAIALGLAAWWAMLE